MGIDTISQAEYKNSNEAGTARPASFAQERLWFLEQLDPGTPVYHITRAYRLDGPLEVDALARSLQRLVDRHESLRTRFSLVDDAPVQVIDEHLPLDLPLVDLTALPAQGRASRAEALVAEEARRAFDLARGPLLRARLYRLEAEAHVLLVVFHHIITDGWSIGIFERELGACYAALVAGEAPVLPVLPVTYADYAVWQRRRLQGAPLERSLGYWRERLSGLVPVELPLDRPRPAVRTHRGSEHAFVVSSSVAGGLRRLARREGATLYMVLLGAFQALVYRYTGQGDVSVGTPVAGRLREEVEGLIGFFVNTLVVRVEVRGSEGFVGMLGRVREAVLGAFEHQEVPFERVVEALHPERDGSRTPFFQVFFNMLTDEETPGASPDSLFRPLAWAEPHPSFDMTVYVVEQDDNIGVHVVYNADLFTASTITQLFEHYQVLLEALVTDPEQPLAAIPLARVDASSSLTESPVRPTPDRPFTVFPREAVEQSIPSRFEQQVAAHADRVAVHARTGAWTYEMLNRRANRIAHALLRRYGTGEGRVALLLTHDAPMIAAMLGALKAGKTYVALDPDYPEARLAFMIEDADVEVILTDPVHRDRAQALARATGTGSVPVEVVDEAVDGEATHNPGLDIPPARLAYLLYTSGTTGRPKGVMQSHRNVLHFIRVYTNNLHLSTDDRLTLLASFSFDAAVMDIYGAVLNGAALYPRSMRDVGVAGLAAWMREQEITVLHATPSVFRAFTESLSDRTGDRLPSVRLVVLGGEAVQRGDAESYKAHFAPGCLFVNGFGPTESTVSLQHIIDHQTVLARATVPIGYPVDDTEVWLLNDAGKDAHVYGEIGIRSAHVALGYWRRPELTQQVFLPDPEGGDRRVYRTGDLGRRLPDGSIEYLGRRDAQVKVRGYRVEPGEVEWILSRHGGVRTCAVVTREDRAGETYLAAYVVPEAETSPDPETWRAYLKSQLPEYMVPRTLTVMPTLPLTAHGKLDQRALPEPVDTDRDAPNYVAPRTPVEEQLASIWAGLLGVERVGVHDNFFDLGGHSLQAVRLFSQVERTLGRALSVATLFNAPTVAELAKRIEAPDGEEAGRWLVPLQPKGSRPPLFCVHGVGGGVSHYTALARSLGPDQPVFGVRGAGFEGEGIDAASVEDLAAAYVEEMCARQEEGPFLLLGFCLGGVVALEMARQLRARGRAVALMSLVDLLEPSYREQNRKTRIDRLLSKWETIRREGVGYLMRWGGRHLRYRLHRLRVRCSRVVAAGYAAGGYNIPNALRREYAIAGYRRLLGTYRPGPYDGEILLFRTRTLRALQDDLGWSNLAREGVRVVDITGQHEDIMQDEHPIAELARHLRAAIDDVLDGR